MAPHRSTAPSAPWPIVLKPEAQRWFMSLGDADARRVTGALDALQQGGPDLGRPRVERIKGSRHHNMKEVRSVTGNLRALFAFDPDRRAVILLGGDKTNNWKRWYVQHIPRADRIYTDHLRNPGRYVTWQATRAGRWSEGRGR